MSTKVGEDIEQGRSVDDRQTLLERIASLEAKTSWFQAQAAQIETLRRLGRWDLQIASGVLTWSEGTYRIFGVCPTDPITVERALSFYPQEARPVIAEVARQIRTFG